MPSELRDFPFDLVKEISLPYFGAGNFYRFRESGIKTSIMIRIIITLATVDNTSL